MLKVVRGAIGNTGSVEEPQPDDSPRQTTTEPTPPPTAEERLANNPVAIANREAAHNIRVDVGGVPGGLPPGKWSFEVSSGSSATQAQQTIEQLASLPGADAIDRVAEAFHPYMEQVYPLRVRNDLSDELNLARGRYVIDGVPRIVNCLLAGNVEEARHPGWVWSLLGENKQEWESMFNDLFAFSLTSPMVKPKMVFQATARKFEKGQRIDAFLSTTERPDFVAKFLEHPGEERRVVAFVLNGTPQRPARAGFLENSGWNEVILPPHLYQVADVRETAFGEVVTLEPRGVELGRLRGEFAAQMHETVPEDVDTGEVD